MKEMIVVYKDHWIIFVGSFFVISIVELTLSLIAKRLFGMVIKPLALVKKISLSNWVLLVIVLVMIALNGYQFIK
jgi:hypothetical protein